MVIKRLSKQEAGRLGGIQTLKRHGKEHYHRLGKAGGKLGGRPKLPTITEIMENASLPEIFKGRCSRTSALDEIKRRYAHNQP